MQQPAHNNSPEDLPQDVRVRVTRSIWGCATGMLGISIPLVAITESPFIPLAVIVGAAVGTVAVWFAPGNRQSTQTKTPLPQVTPEQLRALEERLANVETISSFERGLYERSMTEPVGAPQTRQPEQRTTVKRSLEAPPF